MVVETARETKGPGLGEHTGQSRREKAMEYNQRRLETQGSSQAFNCHHSQVQGM